MAEMLWRSVHEYLLLKLKGYHFTNQNWIVHHILSTILRFTTLHVHTDAIHTCMCDLPGE